MPSSCFYKSPSVRGSYDDSDWYLLKGDYNSLRYPSYVKLDLKINYSIINKEDKKLLLYIDMMNVLNRKNIYKYFWSSEYDMFTNKTTFSRQTLYMMPLLPAIGIEFEF